MYINNKKYWNDKFKERKDKLMSPEKDLVENIFLFNKGTVLDLACGDGRNTIYLLEKGFVATGVDYSTIALDNLNKHASNKKLEVKTIVKDLEEAVTLEDLGKFDNIVINHYRLKKNLLKKLYMNLNYGGILFISGFTRENTKARKEDLILEKEIDSISNHLELIKIIDNEELLDSKTYILKRKGGL
ncbi:MAG TPA: class I SAM-dependent methyltransferase [Tissierellaceae bacterium]